MRFPPWRRTSIPSSRRFLWKEHKERASFFQCTQTATHVSPKTPRPAQGIASPSDAIPPVTANLYSTAQTVSLEGTQEEGFLFPMHANRRSRQAQTPRPVQGIASPSDAIPPVTANLYSTIQTVSLEGARGRAFFFQRKPSPASLPPLPRHFFFDSSFFRASVPSTFLRIRMDLGVISTSSSSSMNSMASSRVGT